MKHKHLFLPKATNNCKKESNSEETCEVKGVCPCPCCGYYTLPVPKEEAIAYICPVCFWENDVFTSNDNEPSDENHGMTLNEGRKNYELFGACAQNMLIYVRKPKSDERAK